ncbi:AraC family transcriptional regulator [Vallitalea pronyensis]|uniref:AraC family transcriptional regulator n=1 Tax=Vallitalea pronyensis TaxID=1348613 RepID=A0A8J8SEP3_9FIRM|nr:AraC family transcriptional regulator [Vallitalea pronyensis]QUI20816.1 AraC family transcriptional regulator [Vallitalea pronyensis]
MYFNQEWENFHGLETDYVKLYYYDFQPGYSDTYHSYAYHRICTIIDGQKHVCVGDEQDFIYTKDEYVLLSPHSKVHMTMPVTTQALVLELSDDLIKDVTNKISSTLDRDVTLNDYNYLRGRMSRLIYNSLHTINEMRLISQDEKEQHFFIDLAVQKLTYGLLKEKESREFLTRNTHHPMKQALDLIKHNYNKGITVSEIAYHLYMSVPNFSHQFKRYFGVTPKHYLMRYKIEKSKTLLYENTVSEVAYLLGYSNVSAFIDVFKKISGMTPKKYQLLKRGIHKPI